MKTADFVDAELIYVRGIAPNANYRFKHALIRDAAYEALLKSRRKELHLRVARAIEEKFPAVKETQPEVLARHWTEAGQTERAINEWLRAGKTAQTRSAFKEALESYQQAVALVTLLPETPERDLRELEYRLPVQSMLWLTRGPSEPETIEASERALALAEKSGNLGLLFSWVLTAGYTATDSGNLLTAAALADRSLEACPSPRGHL